MPAPYDLRPFLYGYAFMHHRPHLSRGSLLRRISAAPVTGGDMKKNSCAFHGRRRCFRRRRDSSRALDVLRAGASPRVCVRVSTTAVRSAPVLRSASTHAAGLLPRAEFISCRTIFSRADIYGSSLSSLEHFLRKVLCGCLLRTRFRNVFHGHFSRIAVRRGVRVQT